MKEYLKRNCVHAKAVGIQASIEKIYYRLQSHKKAPKWIIKELEEMFKRIGVIQLELAIHRDERKKD